MPNENKKPVKAQIAGGPRQKLYQVLVGSGVQPGAAQRFTEETLGPSPHAKAKAKKKKQPRTLREKIIAKLSEIGAKARKAITGS